MKASTIIAGVVLFLGLGLGIGGLALHKKRAIEAASQGGPAYEPMEAVDIVEVGQGPWQPTADLVGTVFAIRSVKVSNELAGVVTSVGFNSGVIVEKGQPIVTLDDATDRADLEAAKAAVRVAEANMQATQPRIELAKRMVERIKSLEGRAMAEADRDRAESDLATGQADKLRWQAEVDQAKARIAQVETRMAKMKIVSPFRAKAGFRFVHEGQYLREGSDIALLQEVTDQIYLDFAIPQEYASRVKPGVAVMATNTMLGPEPTRIEVVAVDATVDNETRNLRVRAIVDNRKGLLSPGMFIQIRVPTEDSKQYQMVPTAAVRRSTYGESVFLVGPDKDGKLRATEHFVKLGTSAGDKVIVLEGLKGGEKVAASGSFKLRNGGLVAPPQAASAAPPAPPVLPAPATQPPAGKEGAAAPSTAPKASTNDTEKTASK